MEFRAKPDYMRVSPQKARLVLDLIKGRRVEEALNTLAFTKKRMAATVEKLLRSAVENANYLSAEKGLDVDRRQPYVKRAIANDGPRMKRIRPAPMGRAYRYMRRIAHLEIVLAEKNRERRAGRRRPTRRQARKRRKRARPRPKAKAKAKRQRRRRRRQEGDGEEVGSSFAFSRSQRASWRRRSKRIARLREV